jgi:hypothetical protein
MDFFGGKGEFVYLFSLLSIFYSWLFKTAFVKFKISNNFKQNIGETHKNNQKSIGNPYQPMEFKI